MRKLLSAVLLAAMLCPACRAAAPPTVSAASAVLVEAGSGRVLYEKDAHARRGIASITKLLTALTAVELEPDLSRRYTMERDFLTEGSSMYLKPGETLTLEELLYGLLLVSGNDAATLIANGCGGSEAAFVARMNALAQRLGMTGSHFSNPHGLDDPDHYSTAYDMALAAREVLKHPALRSIAATRSAVVAGRRLVNHNKLLWRLDGCTGMKTGYTAASGRTLVSSATRGELTLICVTLNAPNDWSDHERLLEYGFSGWEKRTILRQGTPLCLIPVQDTVLPGVWAVSASDFSYPLASGEEVSVSLDRPDRVTAPVQQGRSAGTARFFLNGVELGQVPLVFSQHVEQNKAGPGPVRRIIDWIRGRGNSLAAFFPERTWQ